MGYRTWYHALAVFVIGLVLLASAPTHAQAAERCFPETGHCIAGPIRAYWEGNGGLATFGYPITPQRNETVEGVALPVQWFERDRLELHGATVLAGRLGARALELTERPWPFFAPARPEELPAGCVFVAATSHSLCEPFLSVWQNGGGLPRFGYPITEPFFESISFTDPVTGRIENMRLRAQYFERRRMEIHPELPGAPVLLGLLGREVLSTPEPRIPYPDCLQEALPSLLPAIAQLRLGAPIGCPRTGWAQLPAATQTFERGLMIWLSARDTWPNRFPPVIHTLVEPGLRPDVHSDTWQAGRDPGTAPVTPPGPGLYAPWRGFGKLWMERPEVREALGWATEPQAQPRTVDAQFFYTSYLVRINETGTVYAFGHATGRPGALVVTP